MCYNTSPSTVHCLHVNVHTCTCTCTCIHMKMNKGMLHVHCICMYHKEELDTTSSTASLVLQNISPSTFQFSHKGLGTLICPVEEDDRNRNDRNHRNVA